ncbi:MAG: lipid II:glycine glycyltransferase FemX, partial [Limisphaerales bacterium]
TPDPGWDAFAEEHPQGQFQQSSAWAAAKAPEGWKVRWVQVKEGERIRAGAQILHKRTRAGLIGFINKGPLVDANDPKVRESLIAALVADHRASGYVALLVQPPDGADPLVPHLESAGFLRETVARMADATLLVDVSKGWDAAHAGFRRTTRREIRQGYERGVRIEEGGPDDVPDFFRLMASTCQRQGARPNPANVAVATALVRAFTGAGKSRLWFAVHDGKRVAGGFAIGFGDRVVFWKKGWDQSGNPMHVNTLITADIIRWSAEKGYRWLDFAMMDRDTATAMVNGTELPKDLATRRDFFNLGFGGRGLVMPPCLVRFRNPLVAAGYRLATWAPIREKTRTLLARAGLSV